MITDLPNIDIITEADDVPQDELEMELRQAARVAGMTHISSPTLRLLAAIKERRREILIEGRRARARRRSP